MFPTLGRLVRLILLYKAGLSSIVSNFRPICLSNTLTKLFMSMFARSLTVRAAESGMIDIKWQKGLHDWSSGVH